MSLKVLHTSDWHLGKKLFKSSRLPEQKLFLKWLSQLIQEQETDALLISGDIFDTPHPPHESVKVYFNFLKEITDKTTVKVFIIGGNHDSGRFIEAPKGFLKEKNIYVRGEFFPSEIESKNEKDNFLSDLVIPLSNNQGENVNICMIPYFRNYEILNMAKHFGLSSNTELVDSEHKENIIVDTIKHFIEKFIPKAGPNILMSHHLFGAFTAAGSEQSLSLSGIDSIPSEIFSERFEYLALGHIHKPQRVKTSRPLAVYSGSPIPLRFGETNKKSVQLLSFSGVGTDRSFEIEKINIPSIRPLLKLEVNYNSWKKDLSKGLEILNELNHQLPPFLDLQVNITEPKHELLDEVKEYLQDIEVSLLSYSTIISDQNKTKENDSENDLLKLLDTKELFRHFYLRKFPDEETVPIEIWEDFTNLLNHTNEGDLS